MRVDKAPHKQGGAAAPGRRAPQKAFADQTEQQLLVLCPQDEQTIVPG